ncbi:trigger factor [Pseudochryseolinea flava]|uniref:Trigger factor n=1 Tax=Pseudochryseolinea flava TaxID=2059302 RepID=A0A364Y015_9BACT|nr:trigger factor [Pseudochryseolinea flava]RAV99917.1 trigger factor [Pseudochryseolinea flava]
MEITLNKTNSTEGLIKIKLTEGDYQPSVEEKVKDYAKKANIKGFRQGKVPSGVIKKMFGKSILVDEINSLLTSKISDYIKDNNLKILGEPLPNQEKSRDIDWDTQKDFEFEYQIGMVDEFSYDLSSKVKVTSHPINVDQAVIDDTISDLKKRFGKVSYPETSEAGDNLFGELTGANDFKREYAFIDTTKVEKKEQKKFVGLKKEDSVDFDIEKAISESAAISQLLGIPEEEAKDARGKYTLKVTNISRTEPAEVNTELFDRVFGKDAVTTEADFLGKVKETISDNYKRESEHFLDHNIEDYFINHTNITLPSDFLKTWLKATSKGEITDAVLDNEFNAYVRGLKWDLIKNKIADDNKIEVTTDEVRAKAKEMILAQFGGQAFAEQLGDRMDAIADNYLRNENGQNFMKLFNQLRHERILKFIKEKISVQEKPVSVEEFKKIVAEHKH